jgi:hypothetical protein
MLSRRVIDPKLEEVQVVRFRCEDCRKQVRVHPAGVVAQQQQSRRLQVLSTLLYALGLSYDKASVVLDMFGCGVAKSTIWGNVQELGEQVVRSWRPSGRRPVLGVDETGLKVKGEGITLGFVTDPRSGELVGLEHQLCLAHWRKAVARRLKKIPGYQEEKALIREALKQLDEPAVRTIRWLHGHFSKAPPPKQGEQQTPAYAMRMLSLDITENWHRLTCYQRKDKGLDDLARPIPRDYTVPTTNNATENSIGRAIKVRSKLMRGFKSLSSTVHTTLLVGCVGGVLSGLNFQQVVQ